VLNKKTLTYKNAGVDTKKASSLVKILEKITKKTYQKSVISNPGGFCSLVDLKKINYSDPILLSSTDGVGTKVKIATDLNLFKYIGFDLVAMCVNDILANGGKPIFFLDYISSSILEKKQYLEIISGIADACSSINCSLIGGESAEMPGMYKKGEFDLAGFTVGIAERKNILKKNNVVPDSKIIGIPSSGFHSNGFSLIRKVIKSKKISIRSKTPYYSSEKILGNDLLIPTTIYVNDILPLVNKNLVSSIAHITGGGIYENLVRAIPEGYVAEINFKKFKIPEKFLWIKKHGNISESEMLRTFNCGIGMILIINAQSIKQVQKYFEKNNIIFFDMGKIIKTKGKKDIKINNFGIWNLE